MNFSDLLQIDEDLWDSSARPFHGRLGRLNLQNRPSTTFLHMCGRCDCDGDCLWLLHEGSPLRYSLNPAIALAPVALSEFLFLLLQATHIDVYIFYLTPVKWR